jgi:hypothetical protein
MTKFFKLTDDERKTVILQTGIKQNNLFPQVVEKDLWVTTMLQIIFSLPFAHHMIFKGGTSLGKIWGVIERFSEDIDLAIDRVLFASEGDLTIKQLKKLRKQSSLFVRDTFCVELQKAIEQHGIQHLCKIEPQPDGDGDKTYPEPRKVFVRYQSLFDPLPYIQTEIVLEIGARSLIEPTDSKEIKSLISTNYHIDTSLVDSKIITALPAKTFLEKAFLLHELFTGGGSMLADRKSRHLYDLERMMDKDFATKAIVDDELWNAIHHHREVFTRMSGVDYTPDIRHRICLVPPSQVINDWQQDYEKMQETMIYGHSLPFNKLLARMEELQGRFRKVR